MTVHFSNPGETDPRLLTTLGVNVKSTSSAIGIFGTGFKYALATLLREGQFIQVFSGKDVFNFSTHKDTLRGKEFHFIVMRKNGDAEQALGFTTALGLNWGLQQAYRELYSNMRDEGGDYTSGHPGEGHTTVRVQGKEFDLVHADRGEFLLMPDRICLDRNHAVEVFAGKGQHIFYKGIAAHKLDQPSAYTYNLIGEMTLTEDRTIASTWTMMHDIMQMLSRTTNKTILGDVLCAPKETFERALDFDWSSNRYSEEFGQVLRARIKEKMLDVTPSAQQVYFKGNIQGKVEYDVADLNAVQERYLLDQIDFCNRIGFPLRRENIFVVKSLGDGLYGLAQDGKMYLSLDCFKSYVVRDTLLEEFIHVAHKVADYTRELQNVLFSHIVRLGEELIEERAKIKVIEVKPAAVPVTQKLLDNDEIPF